MESDDYSDLDSIYNNKLDQNFGFSDYRVSKPIFEDDAEKFMIYTYVYKASFQKMYTYVYRNYNIKIVVVIGGNNIMIIVISNFRKSC